MGRDVFVAGVGIIPFAKPGASESYDVMGAQAMRAALQDAHLNHSEVQQVYAGYVYGDSCAGQRAVYAVGMSGMPVITSTTTARPARRRFSWRAKASRHAANNPLALFRKVVTEEEVLNAPVMWSGVMTRLMACPPTCGRAAAIVCSDAFAQRHGLDRSVRIKAQAMTTDKPSTFVAHDMRQVVGVDMTRDAARQVYEQAGVGPQDIQVVELHDCFAHNELLTYEGLGLCADGDAEKFVLDGDNTYGGRYVTNPSGGRLSKGHLLGATGLSQCSELVQQLLGTADKRLVAGARLALQHNLSLGGACVLTLYERV